MSGTRIVTFRGANIKLSERSFPEHVNRYGKRWQLDLIEVVKSEAERYRKTWSGYNGYTTIIVPKKVKVNTSLLRDKYESKYIEHTFYAVYIRNSKFQY